MTDITVKPDDIHLGTVRSLMLQQLMALRAAKPGNALNDELKRSKGVSELSQVLINSARVEVDFLAVTKGEGSGFLGRPEEEGSTTRLPGNANGIASITQHRLGR